MVRPRDWKPVPQDLVQAVQMPYRDTLQSIGQAWKLQALSSEAGRHERPPYLAGLLTLLVRLCSPTPQEWEQVPQLDQPVMMQFSGQLWKLHAWVWRRAAHWTPPYAAATRMLRVRDWYPVPQDLEQAAHLLKAVTTQSTGQLCTLHGCVWVSPGHLWPPKATLVMMERLRLWDPVPQVFEQVLHAENALTLQSTAQASSLQLWVSVRAGQT